MDIEIELLTNSIENSVTGEVFDTNVVQVGKSDKKELKPAEWLFDWEAKLDLKNRQVYKLTTVKNSKIIHGLLCIEDKYDHIFIHLVESMNFNKRTNKMYLGVAGIFLLLCVKSLLRRDMLPLTPSLRQFNITIKNLALRISKDPKKSG